MADGNFDFTLLGDIVVKPATGESADPVQVLTNKGTVLYFGAHWSERKLNILTCMKLTSSRIELINFHKYIHTFTL